MPTITISHYQFPLSDPYSPGPTTLSPGEARALNSLRADNIRNVAARWIRDLEQGGHILTEEEIESISHKIYSYALTFSFESRRELSPRVSSLDQECRRIAEERVDARNRRNNLDFLDNYDLLGKSDRSEAILVEMKLPEVQAEARRRLSARLDIISRPLEDLL